MKFVGILEVLNLRLPSARFMASTSAAGQGEKFHCANRPHLSILLQAELISATLMNRTSPPSSAVPSCADAPSFLLPAGVPPWFIERELSAASRGFAGPNDRPGIALVGCGGMGKGDAGNASRFGDILAVCDVDKGHAEGAAKQFTKDGKVPTQYSDFRKMLERDDIHAVINGTPDHWHTLVNLGATLAGKDVYGEKAADAKRG